MAKAQYISAAAASLTANTDRYRSIVSGSSVATFVTAEVSANTSCEREITFSKLFVRVTTNSKTLSNPTIKFRNNGADGNISISIPFGVTGTYSDTVNTDTVAASNNFCLVFRYGATGTGTLAVSAISIVADYTGIETISIFQNATVTAITAGTRYAGISGYGVNTTTEAQMQLKIPKAGYLKNPVVRIASNTRNGSTTFTLRKNGADTAMVVTIPTTTSGTFKDTSNFISIADNDLVCYKTVVGGSSGTITPICTHIEYETSNDNFITSTEMTLSYAPTGIATYYSYVAGTSVTALTLANSRLNFNLTDYNANNMRVYILTNTVAAGSSTVYLRKNGIATDLGVLIPASTTGHFSDTVNIISIDEGDDLCLEVRCPSSGGLAVKRTVIAFSKNTVANNPLAHQMMLMMF